MAEATTTIILMSLCFSLSLLPEMSSETSLCMNAPGCVGQALWARCGPSPGLWGLWGCVLSLGEEVWAQVPHPGCRPGVVGLRGAWHLGGSPTQPSVPHVHVANVPSTP